MNSNNVRLTLKGKEIHLIGTAHVSRESIDEVTETIRNEKPAMVCVELDQGRHASITQQDSWERLNVSKVLKEGKGFLLIANMALASFQRRMGNELGVKPGEEMIAALNAAEEMGVDYSLCDREIQTTLRRAWASCGLWSKCKLLAALFSSAIATEKLSANEIENLKKTNELDSMMAELANFLPSVKETLIDERDRYLAAKIWKASEAVSGTAPGCTLAVAGAGHLRGIQAHLENFASGGTLPDLAALDSIPPRSMFSRIVGWIIPALILVLIAVGFFHSGPKVGVDMLRYWVLWNGSLAALGAIIALGHPLAILVSFAGAPVTSLNPFIGVGILSGLVQAAVRKPRVCDAENISGDVTTLKGIYRNRISRVLLVFFLSSLGSSIGTFVSIPAIAGLLIK